MRRELWAIDENGLLLRLVTFIPDEVVKIFAADGAGYMVAGGVGCAGGLGVGTGRRVALCDVGWGSEPALQCLVVAPGACRAVGL